MGGPAGLAPVVLGLDIGTTLVKAEVMDASGRQIAGAVSAPIAMSVPQPGWAEQDPDQIWSRIVEVIRVTVDRVAAASSRLVGMAIASQSGSLLSIGDDDQPIGPVVTWMDTRAQSVVEAWRLSGDDATIRDLSGWAVSPGLGLAMIVWMTGRQAELRSATRRFVGVDSFVGHRLTGQWITNPSNAAGLQLFGVSTGEWSAELCGIAGIDPNLLPSVRPTGTVLGSITGQASAATGLPQGLTVINAGHDQACSSLSLGLVESPAPLLATGTAWVLTGTIGSPDQAAPGFNVSHHVAAGRWTTSRFLGGFGGAMEALLDRSYPADDAGEDRISRYARLHAEVAAIAPAVDGAFFEVGERATRPRADAAGRARSARLLMESAAYETDRALRQLGVATERSNRIMLVGGAAASLLWPQVVADVTRASIVVAGEASRPGIGAALIAGVACDLFDQGVYGSSPGDLRVVEPDPALGAHYRRRLAAFRASRPSDIAAG